jgi:hypothetical protein
MAPTRLDTTVDHAVLTTVGNRIVVTAPAYTLEIEDAGAGFARSPYALLFGPDGQEWTAINLLASVHTTAAPDETWELGVPQAQQTGADLELVVEARGTAWKRRSVRLVCTPETVELSVTVEGSGAITDLTVFGGEAGLTDRGTGSYRSAIGFASVLVPVPTEPVQLVRPARSSVALGVVGDADPGRLNGIYAPPPLALGFGRSLAEGATDVPDGEWLGLSVRAAVEELTFTTLNYEPLDGGFRLRLSYEGHTRVHGRWKSPVFVLRPSPTAWGVLDDHRADLLEHGFASPATPSVEPWWREPIFCGWGAQCARAAHGLHTDRGAGPVGDDAAGDDVAVPEPETAEEEDVVVRQAPALARQSVYDEFLAVLAAHDLHPGTIIIDDRWQAEYGTAEPDLEHWPDLRGWIADRHAEGRKVLLWWKAWDPGGLPAEECVRDAGGRPVTVDPANPAYLERLSRIVGSLLSPDGLDADGLQVDFTQRAPSGQTLVGEPGMWGIAALHALLGTLYSAAKRAKPDSLVIGHAIHPSFSDVFDMARLNDVLKNDIHGRLVPVVDQLAFRQEVVSRTLPGHPIDTDQWPMPDREQWLAYAQAQTAFGVPALYYLESIDRSGEPIVATDLAVVADTWKTYRGAL